MCTLRVCHVYWLPLRLKRKECVPSRHQDPLQFTECVSKSIWRRVNDRVPEHSTREHSRFDRKCIELTLFERDVGMCVPSDGEHRLGHVHSDDLEAVLLHQSGHSAWPAPNVGHTNDGLPLDQLDEGHQERTVNRAFGD